MPACRFWDPPSVGSDWQIKILAANGWAGQILEGEEGELLCWEKEEEERRAAMPERSGRQGGIAGL